MTAMFPDSGVPAADAKNSLPAPIINANCEALWYSTSRCQPRFDPAAANAELSELINLINAGGLAYDCTKLDQVQLAVKYLIQRGIPHSGFMAGGQNNYTLTLTPPITGYTDYLTLVVVPQTNNKNNGTYVNVNGYGYVQIVRNDGLSLRQDDLRTGRPQLISYYQGYFFFVGLAPSQVPLVMTANIDAWVRTDGNDTTGDGTSNDAAHAFRTINGAFFTVAGKYAASSVFGINIRLGIPGDYEAAGIGGAASIVRIIGDVNNKGAYRIKGTDNANQGYSLFISSMSCALSGITILMDLPQPNSMAALRIGSGGQVSLQDVRFEATVNNAGATWVYMFSNSGVGVGNKLEYYGNGHTLAGGFGLVLNSSWTPIGVGALANYEFKDTTYLGAVVTCTEGSTYRFGGLSMTATGIVGPQYNITGNAVLNLGGMTCPGTVAGTTSTGGQVLP